MARDALAAQMSHRPATQDAYYMLKQRKTDAVKVTKIIGHVMREDGGQQVWK
jgi:hypothetical protein